VPTPIRPALSNITESPRSMLVTNFPMRPRLPAVNGPTTDPM
jgi:hypothetical protein